MKKNLSNLLCSLALVACAVPGAALAHGSTEPQHGGVVQMNGETLFELVRSADGVMLYVSDDDEPVAAGTMEARLTVSAGGERRDVTMVAGAGNQFIARGLVLPANASVGVLVINKASQARYGTTFTIN